MIDKTKLPGEVLEILSKLQTHGFKSYIVGGSVRDLLLGRNPKDFDICTMASPVEVKSIFKKVIDTGLKFGTVTVIIDNNPIEVTTFRQNTCYKNGHRQSVTDFGDSEVEDVEARDFTINALLYDGQNVIDYVNGLTDLRNRVIRAVGQPDCRFQEDALRMMRAIRLCCQLGFNIEQATLNSVTSNAPLIENAAQERIKEELVKILLSEEPSKGIRLMRQTGLLRYVLPELEACYKFDQRNPYHDKDVFDHTLAVLENTPNNLVVRLAALLHDIAKPTTFTVDDNGIGHFYSHDIEGYALSKLVLSRLKFDNKTIDSVSILVKEHMSKLKVLHKAAIKKLINRVGPDKINRLIDLQIADEAGSRPPHDFRPLIKLREEIQTILSEKEPLGLKDLAVNGSDIIKLGVRRGPQVGKILNELLERVITNPELNTKEILLRGDFMDWHADMSEKELEEFLHNGIPMTKQMGFSVKEFTPWKVKMGAKLEPNLNHHSTAFGGSINSLMTVCGWSLVFNNIKSVDPNANLVIQKSSIEFKKPVAQDFTAECEFSDDEDRNRFLETYKRIGKARVEIVVLVKVEEETAAEFRGYFVAFR